MGASSNSDASCVINTPPLSRDEEEENIGCRDAQVALPDIAVVSEGGPTPIVHSDGGAGDELESTSRISSELSSSAGNETAPGSLISQEAADDWLAIRCPPRRAGARKDAVTLIGWSPASVLGVAEREMWCFAFAMDSAFDRPIATQQGGGPAFKRELCSSSGRGLPWAEFPLYSVCMPFPIPPKDEEERGVEIRTFGDAIRAHGISGAYSGLAHLVWIPHIVAVAKLGAFGPRVFVRVGVKRPPKMQKSFRSL